MRALLLDAHGTLLHLVEPVVAVYQRVAARHGVHREAEAIRRALRVALPAYDQAGGRDYWRAVVADALGTSDPALFDELFATYASARAWRLDTAGSSLLSEAHARGYPIAIVSNMDARLHTLLAAFDLRSRLDAVVLAEEVGRAKPDPLPFRVALERLGASEAVHVGDHPVEDLDAAAALGLLAVDARQEGAWARARDLLLRD